MSQSSITGLLRLCSVDSRDRASLEEIEVYRRDSAGCGSKKWYKTSLQTGNFTKKMGFVYINACDDPGEGRLLHRVCFISGGFSYGMADTSEIRFVIDAKEILLFDLNFDSQNETLALPHSISATGLCKRLHDTGKGIHHEMYMMNRCIYSGISSFFKMLYVYSFLAL